MGHHIIEYDEECPSCKGTGLYVGMAERDGSAVVCVTCNGTGCHHVKLEYDDFTKRKRRYKVERVVEINPGICIGSGGNNKYSLEDFGGMPYKDWFSGKSFPPKSENRRFTCPAWWYQSANYDLKPKWDKCAWGGAFSNCKHFKNKDACWKQWDEENP